MPVRRLALRCLWLALAILVFVAPSPAAAQGDERQRVVVVGAGYGGLEVARRLSQDRKTEVVLVDKAPEHTAITRLHERAARGTRIGTDFARVADELGVRYVRGEVTGIDAKARRVSMRGKSLDYDALVVAVGAETAYPPVPGLAQHSLGLRTARDATRVRSAVLKNLDRAARTRDPAARRALGRVVIGGAGPTGVELAAELAESLPELAKERGLDPNDVSVVLVQRSDILSSAEFLRDGDRRLVRRKLERMGVKVMTETQLSSISPDYVQTDGASGQTRLRSNLVIWTGGVRAPRAISSWGLPLDAKTGRIQVDRSLQVAGMKGVFAVGDAAAVTGSKGEFAAMTAQEAVSQAKVASNNILRRFRSVPLKHYAPRSRGMLISLGRKDGVGRILGLRVSGRLAARLKRVVDYKQERKLGPTLRQRVHGSAHRVRRGTVRAWKQASRPRASHRVRFGNHSRAHSPRRLSRSVRARTR